MKTELQQAMRGATVAVLETMFFSEPILQDASEIPHINPLPCDIECSGAEDGIFHVLLDHEALLQLCRAFYGDDEDPSEKRQHEVLCEFTNMVAGSTLSSYATLHACRLSPPSLCNPEPQPAKLMTGPLDSASVALLLEGGVLSITCQLRSAA